MLYDSREKGKLPELVAKEFDAEKRALDAGDYWIVKDDGVIIIERSTYADFSGKIISGRISQQADKCLEHSDDIYFILENPSMVKYGKISYKSILGMIVSLTRKGIKVISTKNSTETLHVIRYLHDRYESGKSVDVSKTRIKPRNMTSRETAINMLMGVEGIGEKTAKKLLTDKSLLTFLNQINNEEIPIPFNLDKVVRASEYE